MKYMMDFYETLRRLRFLPLYTVNDLQEVDSVEAVLIKQQLPVIEITLRSEVALKAIKQLSQNHRVLVGAGTVRSLQQAKQAIEHGAQFIVCPAVIPEVITYCIEQKVPILPGVATPSDIQRVVDLGIHVVKYFPADINGGLKGIQALSGPFYDVLFVPTGGINQHNCEAYLQHEQVLAIGGSYILSEMLKK